MILAALALQVALPTRADEVTVIGQRLKTWRGAVRSSGGKATCRTTKSTGDRQIDAIGCAALTGCSTPLEARMIALAKDKALAPAERKARQAAINDELGRCMVARRDKGIEELADQRAAARARS